MLAGFLAFINQSCSSDSDAEVAGASIQRFVGKSSPDGVYTAELVELSDSEYPDNPDIDIRSELDGRFAHSNIRFSPTGKHGYYDIVIDPENADSDTIRLSGVNLLEWIPTVPEAIRSDPYLTLIGLNNQEWNRFQVRFNETQFELAGERMESVNTTRFDLANNCLQTGLWEVITYTEEDGKQKPCYHGWFDFPPALYAELFVLRNGMSFDDHAASMVDFVPTESRLLNTSLLRTVHSSIPLAFEELNAVMYPLIGERSKKATNIVYPENCGQIADFHTDEALFATFSPPGVYVRSDPRSTQLGRFTKLDRVTASVVNSTISGQSGLLEFELGFSDADGRHTTFVLGGIDPARIPVQPLESAHKGWQMPMGIANHSFYESYEEAMERSSLINPWYAYLTDGEGKWIDSHDVGIDGPLMHRDAQDPSILHLWILSFERHALVGHYLLNTAELPGFRMDS